MSSKQQHKCEYCNKLFENEQTLSLHSFSFTDIKTTCRVCGAYVAQCMKMSEHLETHPSCAFCDKYFSSPKEQTFHKLTKHMDTVPPKLYLSCSYGNSKCFVCNMVFEDSSLADIHTRRDHSILRIIYHRKFDCNDN